MFTQKCFIRKNTQELVNKLEKLGYEIPFVVEYGNGDTILAKYGILCNIHSIPNSIFGENYFSLLTHSAIDCGTNEELFLAIAALRDDTDNMQWFTDGNGYWQLCIGSFKFPSLAKEKLHNATVPELIEHFKS